MSSSAQLQQAIEDVLKIIIDEWYEKVSSFYVTAEQIAETGVSDREEELKRFHDENGHRIKFSKDDLDFTYGLRSYWEGDSLLIEVSVNNKVADFNFDEFRDLLAEHYLKEGQRLVPTPYELRSKSFDEIFTLENNFNEALKLELREGKADIMRLSFRLSPEHLDKLLARPVSSKELVEKFCVTPFRNIYASVYRRGS